MGNIFVLLQKTQGMNLAITFFPIYGLTLGINYIDNELQDVQRTDGMRGSEEHTSELQSRLHLVCRLLLGTND